MKNENLMRSKLKKKKRVVCEKEGKGWNNVIGERMSRREGKRIVIRL